MDRFNFMRSTPEPTTVVRQIRRRLAVICAALTCAFALLIALATADANAAGVQDARSDNSAATGHLNPSTSASPRSTRAFWNNTDVYFRNNHATTVSVAIMRQSDDCASTGGFEYKGWYNVAPGQVRYLFGTTNRYAYFYAHAADGATWSGDYGRTVVGSDPFRYCEPIGSTNPSHSRIGFREIDTSGYSSYTISVR